MEDQSTSDDFEDGDSRFECAICLQTCIQPVQLPCNHVFCYLCVKGIIHQSKRCAMCRQEIPPNFLDNPHLIQVHQSEVSFEDGYQWYYEGRNGWWQYDERTSAEIESAFERGSQECEVLIAGFLYVIDFQNLVQMRRSDLFRKRRIKRDLCSIPKKGVAGIRVQNIPVGKAQPKANDIVSEDPSHSNDPSTQDENRIFESGDILVSSSEPLDLSKSGSSSSKSLDLSKSGISSSKSLDISKEASEYGAVSKEPNESEKSPLPRRSRRQRK